MATMSIGKRWRVTGFDYDRTSMMIMTETYPWFTLEQATEYVKLTYPTFQWPAEGWVEDRQRVIDINYCYPLEQQLESAEFWYHQNQTEDEEEARKTEGD